MIALLRDIIGGLAESIRESLPSSVDEAGPFVAGMAWAFAIFWAVLILVTWSYCKAHGGGC